MSSSDSDFVDLNGGDAIGEWKRWARWVIAKIKEATSCIHQLDDVSDEHEKRLVKLEAAREHRPEPCPASSLKVDMMAEVAALKVDTAAEAAALKLDFTRELAKETTERKLLGRDLFWKTSIIGVIAGAIPPTILLIVLGIRWFLTRGPPTP